MLRVNIIKLKLILGKLRMTQDKAAAKAGIGRATLTKIMKYGDCNPITLDKLAKALGVDPAELLQED